MGHFEDGDLVLVRDFDGYGLGKGFINRHSKIRDPDDDEKSGAGD